MLRCPRSHYPSIRACPPSFPLLIGRICVQLPTRPLTQNKEAGQLLSILPGIPAKQAYPRGNHKRQLTPAADVTAFWPCFNWHFNHLVRSCLGIRQSITTIKPAWSLVAQRFTLTSSSSSPTRLFLPNNICLFADPSKTAHLSSSFALKHQQRLLLGGFPNKHNNPRTRLSRYTTYAIASAFATGQTLQTTYLLICWTQS